MKLNRWPHWNIRIAENYAARRVEIDICRWITPPQECMEWVMLDNNVHKYVPVVF